MVFADLIGNGNICWALKPSDLRYILVYTVQCTVLASVILVCNFIMIEEFIN